MPRAYQLFLVIVILLQSYSFISQSSNRHTERLEMLFNTGRYEDAYDLVQSVESRDGFSRITHQIKQSLYAKKMTITIAPNAGPHPSSSGKAGTIAIQIDTPLGMIEQSTIGQLTNDLGLWKLKWEWDYLVKDFNPQASIQFIEDDQTAGNLITKDGVILSKSTIWPHIIVIPQLLEQPPDIRPQLSSITGLGPLSLNYTIHVNQPADMSLDLGIPKVGFSPSELDYIASHSAVLLDYRYDIDHRLYPQGAIDNGFVDLIKSIEVTNPLFPQYRTGSFVMTDQSGIQTEILSNQKILTQDIVLDQTVDQLFGPGARTVF